MALHYDISKIKQIQNLEEIQRVIKKLSLDIENIKVFVEDKQHNKVSEIIDEIISNTEILGIDSAFEEAQQVKNWSKTQGKRKEIKITLKDMISDCKDAIKEIKKDFLAVK